MLKNFASLIQPPRKLKAIDQEIEWAGVAWVCAKQLTHYPAFHRNEITIAVSLCTSSKC